MFSSTAKYLLELARPTVATLDADIDERCATELNTFQAECILELQEFKLTSLHFNDFNAQKVFGYEHKHTLLYFIRTNKLTPESAIALLNTLTPLQVQGIARGLTLDETVNMNAYQIDALTGLKNKGVNAAILREWESSVEFSYDHFEALSNLIQKHGLTPLSAIRKISGITRQEAEELCDLPYYVP